MSLLSPDYLNLENILLGRPLTDAFNQKYFVEKEEYEVALNNSRKKIDLLQQREFKIFRGKNLFRIFLEKKIFF